MIQDLHHVSGNVVPVPSRSGPQVGGKDASASFQQILEDQLNRSDDLKFSMHAQERICQRHIVMGAQGVERLKNGVDRIAEKGGRESLVLMDDSAFLVSVRNRTVITAIGRENLKDNVFTNIDSTIVV